MKQPIILAMLGRSGSGKGTQSQLLQERFSLEYIGSGDLLREVSSQDDFTGKKLRAILHSGGFAPTAIIFKEWINKFEKFKNNQNGFNGFIIDGSPRKIMEAYLLKQSLGWYEWNSSFRSLFIDIPRKEAKKRLLSRRICKKCSNLIPGIGDFANLKKCNKCGGELTVRADDTEEGIKKRLDLFEEEVVPIVEYYRDQNDLIEINGEQSIEKVFENIIEALKLKK